MKNNNKKKMFNFFKINYEHFNTTLKIKFFTTTKKCTRDGK